MNAPFQDNTPDAKPLNLLIAAPRGFCAGVDRAIEIVEKSLERYGAPVYVRHEIVHNKFVVEGLKAKGAIFVKELDEVPSDAPVVFSAHGVVENIEDVDKLPFDADEPLAYLTQTTLSVDDTREVIEALEWRYPNIRGPKAEDICYATSNRQAAVKELARDCDLVLVVGAPNSSNSLRLVEVAERLGTPGKLIQRADEIDPAWLDGVETIGLTAGASAPELLVREVVDALAKLRPIHEQTITAAEEKMVFKLPRQLTE